jgi:hypothetical protein
MPRRELRGAVVGRDEEVARLRREGEALLAAATGGGPAPHLHVGFPVLLLGSRPIKRPWLLPSGAGAASAVASHARGDAESA